ncbi:MAG: endonuclease/exonuclease/phosphatase family protein [Candidatus Omnitrophota bacterium]|nr:endonuclease/exonuclease/phosphatase family protein [Candidatus Omnitrophota bacterium]
MKSADLGPFLRVASWNIEKSIKANEAIQFFTSDSAFRLMINPETQKDPLLYRKIMGQRERLLGADILILQEMEIGIKRSGYLNAAEELAKALDMNYAYATQYLEVDPVILGLENIRYEDGNVDTLAMDFFAADPAKYKGMFGGAVLSRYPIKHVEVRPLKTQPYDWYAGEKKRTTFLEEARRFGSLSVFKNEITREMKVGGRTYFRVDLDVPGLPSHTLTVINIHLEIKCLPQAREAQLTEIFSYIRDIKNPVILMGDFNAAPTDISPTSLTRVAKRTAKNPTTWFGVAVNAVSPHGLALNTTRGLSNVTKNFNDPFAKDIKVVAPNPLLSMFEMIRDYRFRDGGVFDFRGDPKRSVGEKEKILANSNQRGNKGFRTSFSTRRTIGNLIGKLRLDWVFVKSYLKTESTDVLGPYKFAPHFGETLEEMNANLITPISDHHPNVVDLPFNEPNI